MNSRVSNIQQKLSQIKETLSSHNFTYLRSIGYGGFSSVHLVLSQKYNLNFVVKVSGIRDCNDIRAEIDTLMNIEHPNIISIFEHFEDSDFLYIILEYCEGGSLADVLKEKGPLRAPGLYNICHQVIMALKACHDLKIAHRDIKPANILIDKNGRPKLADFGLSKMMDIDGEESSDSCGSKPYMAPEIFRKTKYNPFIADIWSLGITFFEISTGKRPWAVTDDKELRFAIALGMISFQGYLVPPTFAILVKKMCCLKTGSRATLEYLLEQPIFQRGAGANILKISSSRSSGKCLYTIFKTKNRIRNSTTSDENFSQSPVANNDNNNNSTDINIDNDYNNNDGNENTTIPKEKPTLSLAGCGSVISFSGSAVRTRGSMKKKKRTLTEPLTFLD